MNLTRIATWKTFAAVCLGIVASAAAQDRPVIGTIVVPDDEFVPLFDGETLDGWVVKGGQAKYTVENGELVGTAVPREPNSFLCTEKHYANFVLELEFKVHPLLNSGVQIRSHAYDEPKVYQVEQEDGSSKEIKVAAGRVHGYQVEIDPSPRAWSGGIYDEGRRAWIYNLDGDERKPAREAFQSEDWNHFRVEAVGPSIKTWINGVPAADLHDDMTPSGFIGLQVHGVGRNEKIIGTQIRFRNIRIKELDETARAAPPDVPWVVYEGREGPGKGKHVVLIAGDEEYRSEEALPQLGKILAQRHGFTCTVLFPIDSETGLINPNVTDNIPGTEALETADLMILSTRFRNLPDEQMQPIDAYLKAGKPVIGIRTATHAFNVPEGGNWAHYGNYYEGDRQEWQGGFGRFVLGEKWISHHGRHKHQSTRGLLTEQGRAHPILRGIADGDIWGPTDVYGVRLPLPGDSQPLVLGQVVHRAGEFDAEDVLFGMRPSDSEPDDEKNDPMMPVVWLKSYQLPGGSRGQALTSTIGASTDLLSEGVRRMLVNGTYVLTGLEEQIPETGTEVDFVGPYEPTAYEFRKPEYWRERKMTVDEHRLQR